MSRSISVSTLCKLFLLSGAVALGACAKKTKSSSRDDAPPPAADDGGGDDGGGNDGPAAGEPQSGKPGKKPDDGQSDGGQGDGGQGDQLPVELAKVVAAEAGVYHGAFTDLPEVLSVGDAAGGTTRFEQLVGKPLAFTIIGDNWVEGIAFPRRALQEIADQGRIPVVHVKPWSIKRRSLGGDPVYDLSEILAGAFDVELTEYAKAARAFRHPVVLDFAPEANGDWYPWSGTHSGGGWRSGYGDPNLADGPERYRDAYRKVVDLFRAEGASNVTFVFHVSSDTKPMRAWNKLEAYYPGDEYVDWLAVSAYSAQLPGDMWEEFTDVMDHAYPLLQALSETKPIAVLEYGIIEDPFVALRKADWISNALNAVKAGRYPRVKAMAYWHESSWIATGDNDMRVDSSVSSLRAYKDEIADPFFLSQVQLKP